MNAFGIAWKLGASKGFLRSSSSILCFLYNYKKYWYLLKERKGKTLKHEQSKYIDCLAADPWGLTFKDLYIWVTFIWRLNFRQKNLFLGPLFSFFFFIYMHFSCINAT